MSTEHQYIEKICNSKTFAKSPTSIALLKYLFESTKNGIDLKETTIDIEFFKIDQSNKSPKARVSVYNLRKKLDNYYSEEGKDDKYLVSIDKGQYLVTIEKKKVTSKFKAPNLKVLLPYILIAIIACIYLIQSIPESKPKIWKPFLEEKSTLYIGDVFGMYGETITGNDGWIRDYSINSPTDFYNLLDSIPELKEKLTIPNNTYTSLTSVTATKKLQSLFDSYDSDFDLRFSSTTSTSEIKDNNGIYVGPLHNSSEFITYFNSYNKYLKYDKTNRILKLENHPNLENQSLYFGLISPEKEYAIVSKVKANNGKEYFLLFSDHGIGVTACIDYFTDPIKLEQFTNLYLSDKELFTAVFEITGTNRTDTSTELILVVPF